MKSRSWTTWGCWISVKEAPSWGWLLEVSARTVAHAADSPQEALVQVSRRHWEYVEHVLLPLRLVLPGAATCDAANEAITPESLCSQIDGWCVFFSLLLSMQLQMAAAHTSALGIVFTAATAAQCTTWDTFTPSVRAADGDGYTLPAGKHLRPCDSAAEWNTRGSERSSALFYLIFI